MNIMQRQFGPKSQRREPRESLGEYSLGHQKNSLGDQEKSLGETSPGDQETFLRVFPPGDYLLVTKRNFLVFMLLRLTACFSGPLRRLTAYILRQSQSLTACFSGPLRRIAAYFSAPFTLTFFCESAILEVKGVKNEIFALLRLFMKVISFIYQNRAVRLRFPPVS